MVCVYVHETKKVNMLCSLVVLQKISATSVFLQLCNASTFFYRIILLRPRPPSPNFTGDWVFALLAYKDEDSESEKKVRNHGQAKISF